MTSPTKAALYLRTGTIVTPGIMTVGDGMLSFATPDAEVFKAPISSVRAEFTTYSTLVIHVPGARHVFVTGAYAGAFASRFSPEQIAELVGEEDPAAAQREFADSAVLMVTSSAVRNSADLVGSSVGSALGIVGGVIGVKRLYQSQAASFALAKAWAEHLADQGVAVEWKGSTFGRSQVGVTLGVIGGVALLTVGVYALVSALQG